MCFEPEMWSTDQVKQVRFCNDPLGQEEFYSKPGREDWLFEAMRTQGSWPTPIIVLDNEDLDYDLGRIQLLEGHRRLSYFNLLDKSQTTQPQHNVWVARIC
ncbi:MAG: hypothetical protein GY811_11510 [Myxococcales bacterium]|nr:hypothetical protein [Myxococcales bacterium]